MNEPAIDNSNDTEDVQDVLKQSILEIAQSQEFVEGYLFELQPIGYVIEKHVMIYFLGKNFGEDLSYIVIDALTILKDRVKKFEYYTDSIAQIDRALALVYLDKNDLEKALEHAITPPEKDRLFEDESNPFSKNRRDLCNAHKIQSLLSVALKYYLTKPSTFEDIVSYSLQNYQKDTITFLYKIAKDLSQESQLRIYITNFIKDNLPSKEQDPFGSSQIFLDMLVNPAQNSIQPTDYSIHINRINAWMKYGEDVIDPELFGNASYKFGDVIFSVLNLSKSDHFVDYKNEIYKLLQQMEDKLQDLKKQIKDEEIIEHYVSHFARVEYLENTSIRPSSEILNLRLDISKLKVNIATSMYSRVSSNEFLKFFQEKLDLLERIEVTKQLFLDSKQDYSLNL